MAWLDMTYMDAISGRYIKHTAYILNAGHFLDIISRYRLTADHIEMLQINGRPMDAEKLIERSRRKNHEHHKKPGEIV